MSEHNPQSLIKKLRTAAHPPWTEHAACARPGVDRSAFFTEDEDDVHAKARAAKAICATCPVTVLCAEYGDLISVRFGTFGGLTASERKARRSLGRAA